MVAALQLIPPKPTFLRDRYFPSTDTELFVTEDVLIDYKDDSKWKMAPCGRPRSGGIPVGREGYRT